MAVKFEINLKDLCIINIAKSLWNQEAIVNKEKVYFSSPTTYLKIKMWDTLTKDVINQIDPQSLPEIFYTQLVYAVDSLGKQKRDFFTYCRMRNIFRDVPREKLYEIYFKNIYWTYYGTIDVEKIIKSWFHDPECNLWKIYVMACCFCPEDFIKEIWLKVKKIYKPKDFEELLRFVGWNMAAYWDKYFCNALDGFTDACGKKLETGSIYSNKQSLEENMFNLSVSKGYKLAAENFFFGLSEESKKNIHQHLETAVHRYNYDEGCSNTDTKIATYYRENQSIEIVLFILNSFEDFSQILPVEDEEDKHYGYFDKSEFFNDFFEYFTCWPYINLIMPFVNKYKTYLNEENYEGLLKSIIASGRQEYFPVSMDNIYQRIFLQLWKLLPLGYKEKFCENRDLIAQLFSVWDTASLKIILNDKNLLKMRDVIIVEGCDKFESFLEEDNQEKIKEFINVLIPTDWEKNIQVNMEKVYEHVMKGEFHLANELLNSFCHTEKEMTEIKNTVNSDIICLYFIKKRQFDLADKFLFWKLNSEKSVIAFKSKFVDDPFAADQILKYWNKKKECAKEARLQSENFLKWFLKEKSRESIMEFIKKQIKNSGKLRDFVNKGLFEHYEIIDKLLTWCSMNKEEKKSFKEMCFSDKKKLMAKIGSYMQQSNHKAAQELLNWKFDSKYEKEEFRKKFLKSSRWAFECIIFLINTFSSNMFEPQQPISDEQNKKLDEFIKCWMRPIEKKTMKDFKKFLMNWPNTLIKLIKEYEQHLRVDNYSTDEFDIESSEFDLEDSFKYMDIGEEEGGFVETFRNRLSKFYKRENYFDYFVEDLMSSDEEEHYYKYHQYFDVDNCGFFNDSDDSDNCYYGHGYGYGYGYGYDEDY